MNTEQIGQLSSKHCRAQDENGKPIWYLDDVMALAAELLSASGPAEPAQSAEPIGYVNSEWHKYRRGTTTLYPEPHPRIATLPLHIAPQPSPTAVVLDDERAALRILFEAAFNAGWDRSDDCDNAYNNGTSEQLSVPSKAQEPPIFQEWRAQYFSDRSEVVESLIARAASTQPLEQTSGEATDNAEPPRHIIDAAMDVARNEYGHGVTRASVVSIWKALGNPWYVAQATVTLPLLFERIGEKLGLLTPIDPFYEKGDLEKWRAQSDSVMDDDQSEEIEECREILSSLMSNIEEGGSYSAEATCTFLRQALNCLPSRAVFPQPVAQTERALTDDARKKMIADLEAEKTYLGSSRDTCSEYDKPRWDRLQVIADHLSQKRGA